MLSKTLALTGLSISLALFAFVPAAAANPITDMQCGSVGGCCPTALSCICGTSTLVTCVEKIVTETVILPSLPATCSEFTGTCTYLVCVSDGTAHVCVPDPCRTVACTLEL